MITEPPRPVALQALLDACAADIGADVADDLLMYFDVEIDVATDIVDVDVVSLVFADGEFPPSTSTMRRFPGMREKSRTGQNIYEKTRIFAGLKKTGGLASA